MKINSLQTRIALFFVLLMLGVQLVGLWATHTVTTSNARETLRERLLTGARVFERVLTQNREQLGQAARVLASDFGFREAVATADRETIISALENHGGRINAQLTALISLDRRIVADTLKTPAAGREPALQILLTEAEANGRATGMVQLDGTLYQIVTAPIRAPALIGWVAFGIAVDDKAAAELKRVVGLDVSFLTKPPGGPLQLQATTLGPALAPALVERLTTQKPEMNEAVELELPGGTVTALPARLVNDGSGDVFAVLQESLEDSLAPVRRLQGGMLALSLIGLVVSVIGSVMIARSLARPVRQLSDYAQRIESGDYDAPPNISRPNELGELAEAFDQMREGLALREARITELAHRDSLTGLPNRALFQDRALQALAGAARQSHSVSVLMMDLDRFKYVNDALGHHCGDLLLVEAARRLESVVRRGTDTVARLGGDEFAVLLPGDRAEGGMLVARKIIAALESPMLLEGHAVDIHASIGVATYPEHGEDLVALMRHADIAMYQAKQNKLGVNAYDSALQTDSKGELSLMSELRTAVAEDQLTLFYQPKVSFARRRWRQAEALVRWIHPSRGFVAPDAFIPYAEQTGCIKLITRWVLNEAARQQVEWVARGMPVDLSVNISARDLMAVDFPEVYADILHRHGCNPAHIALEITEGAMLDDPARALETLIKLRDKGCRLSIDDFGTGYSSLSYLKRLPVTELKIDRSFVMGMAGDRGDATIVRSTIDLAHNMGLTVVAEGVESEAIFRLLKDLGCDAAQGYALSRPVDAKALYDWMRASHWVNDGKVATPEAA